MVLITILDNDQYDDDEDGVEEDGEDEEMNYVVVVDAGGGDGGCGVVGCDGGEDANGDDEFSNLYSCITKQLEWEMLAVTPQGLTVYLYIHTSSTI